MLKKAVALVALLTTTACYSYVPMDGSLVPEGVRVRAEISDMGRAQLSTYLGPSVDWVEGQVVTSAQDSLVMAARMVSSRFGDSFWDGERVSLPRSYVLTVHERKLSTARTALLAGAVLGGVVLLGRTLGIGSTSGTGRIPVDPEK